VELTPRGSARAVRRQALHRRPRSGLGQAPRVARPIYEEGSDRGGLASPPDRASSWDYTVGVDESTNLWEYLTEGMELFSALAWALLNVVRRLVRPKQSVAEPAA